MAVLILIAILIYTILRMLKVKPEDVADKNVQAFLGMIRFSEDKANITDEQRYRTLFGGDTFDNGFVDHPRIKKTYNINGKPVTSDAAGAYGMMSFTWDWLRKIIDLPDFTPANQDTAAVQLMIYRNSLDDIKAGNLVSAIQKNANTWASLPGNDYGQNPNSFDQLQQKFTEFGGTLAPNT